MSPSALSVIIPTYNERDSLPTLLDRLARVAAHVSLEVVIVDDGSPDGTGELADRLARKAPMPVRVVHRPQKAGLASAVIDGVRLSQGAIVTVMDADLSHPPELLAALAAAVADGADGAVASRYVPGGGIEAWSPFRRVLSCGATWLARAGLGLAIRDPLSGYFAVRRELLTGGAYRRLGYKLLMEILAAHPGARVVEIPYRFVDRQQGSSKLSAREMCDFLRLLARLRRERSPWS